MHEIDPTFKALRKESDRELFVLRAFGDGFPCIEIRYHVGRTEIEVAKMIVRAAHRMGFPQLTVSGVRNGKWQKTIREWMHQEHNREKSMADPMSDPAF